MSAREARGRWLAMLAWFAGGALAACAAGSSRVGITGGGPGGQAPDGGVASSTGSSTSGGGSGGGTPMGDSLPGSAVSFFQSSACPTGWEVYIQAAGRFIVPTVATAMGGLTAGTPLAPGEDRTHTHAVNATFTLGSVSYVGVAGGANGGVAGAGDVSFMVTAVPASTGLPYVQLLACKKTVAPVPHSAPLPKGLQMFFDLPSCPTGWEQAAATQGRFIVGLPQGAAQDVTFGGPPLSSLDGGVMTRVHAHPNTATLTTTSHGIALASGCCGDGYAANGTVMSTADTSDADAALPFIELLSCEKQ